MQYLDRSEGLQISSDQRAVDLMSGIPSLDVLPDRLIAEAAQRSLAKSRSSHLAHPLAYGDDTAEFGQCLTRFIVDNDYRMDVNPSLIVPVAGVSNALDMLCTFFCRSLDRSKSFVFVEDVTYYLSMGIFRDHGLNVRSIKTDGDGLCVSDLASQLEQLRISGDDFTPAFIYVIPAFNNPLGVCLSLQRRRELIEVSREYGLPVVADEVYQLLNFTDEARTALASLRRSGAFNDVDIDTIQSIKFPKTSSASCTRSLPSLASFGAAHVFVVSSLSKILAPGLRVGWIEFPSEAVANDFLRLGVLVSGSCISHFASTVAAATMATVDGVESDGDAPRSPLAAHLAHLKQLYAVKYAVLLTALHHFNDTLLPSGDNCTLQLPLLDSEGLIGGYFIWVRLPLWVTDVSVLNDFWSKHGLKVRAGTECSAMDERGRRRSEGCVRLCFARASLEDLKEGARRLCLAVHDAWTQLNSATATISA
jgi:2-aminoadipate transaminase